MDDEQFLAYISAVPSIGRKTLSNILVHCSKSGQTLEQVFTEQLHQSTALLSARQVESLIAFKKQYTVTAFHEMLAQNQLRFITTTSQEYPSLLRHIDDKPLVLYAKGERLNTTATTIALVGARRMTAYGKSATECLVRDLSGYDATIVSGCMYGVDMCAHQEALSHNIATIGVLGFGFKHVFPASFRKNV